MCSMSEKNESIRLKPANVIQSSYVKKQGQGKKRGNFNIVLSRGSNHKM